ncbi:phage tail domain-containing protein [Clostridium pasteurianum]|uniref:Phage-related protein n=1 Tax=Clostridium pasteurianum BC1 TaxID=86416 RepID=R4JX61_CLOPA|nr:phage tail domain-containing protein [Clostridium pasteurianum]AGK95412.1 phage-related protein [Clostridium pasteurianum BC1]
MSNKIIFNSKSNEDFSSMLSKFIPNPPPPRIIKKSVPGRSSSYDFSKVASGEPVFDDRQLECSLLIEGNSRADLNQKYSKILSWLMSGGSELLYSDDPGYQYIAQIEDKPQLEYINICNALLTFSFTAKPYKEGVDLAGELLWNNIDFNRDYIQTTKFDVSGSKTVTIYNPGDHMVSPKVVTNSSMSCSLNDYTAVFDEGKDTDWGFKLKVGANVITIVGTGNIDFQFRKEVL